MNGGRQHGAPEQFSRAEISIRGLACPFAKFDPETYMNIDACRPNDGFKEARLLLYVHPRPPVSEERRAAPPVLKTQVPSKSIWLTRLLQRAHMA